MKITAIFVIAFNALSVGAFAPSKLLFVPSSMPIIKRGSMTNLAHRKNRIAKYSRSSLGLAEALASNNSEEEQILAKEYTAWNELKRVQNTISKNSIFALLEPGDLLRVATSVETVKVKVGEVVIKQGANDHAMFFVAEGIFACYGKKEQEELIFKTYVGSGYFGELALFFSTPRALTIRAVSDGTLLRLSRESFDSAVQDSEISSGILEILLKAYDEESVWRALPKLSFDELRQALIVKSRPKMSPVSLHSTLSTLATGTFISSVLPFFDPGYNEVLQIPQIFDLVGGLTTEPILKQQLFAMWALAITGVMGVFRLSPTSRSSRTAFFMICSTLSVIAAFLCSSNVTGASYWLIDAFVAPWNVLIPIACLLGVYVCLWCIDEAITGDMRGRDTLPLIESRLSAACFYSATALVVGAGFAQFGFAPLYSDKATFEQSVLPFIQGNGIEGTIFTIMTITTGGNCYAALLATLKIEKKLSATQAQIALVVGSIIFYFDSCALLFSSLQNPDSYVALNEEGANYYTGLGEHFHIVEGTSLAIVATALNAYYRKSRMEKEIKE